MEEETLKVKLDGKEYKLKVRRSEGKLELQLNGKKYNLKLDRDEGTYFVDFKGKVYPVKVNFLNNGLMEIDLHGEKHEVFVKRFKSLPVRVKRILRRIYVVKSPIPGKIISIPVKEGQIVKENQTLVVIEAMKMRNEIKSPRKGLIRRIRVSPSQFVEKGDVLIEIQLV